MSIKSDWRTNPLRRNFRDGAVVIIGNVPLSRRTSPTKAWQRDATRGLPTLATVQAANPDPSRPRRSELSKSRLPRPVKKLKDMARSLAAESPFAGRKALGASR